MDACARKGAAMHQSAPRTRKRSVLGSETELVRVVPLCKPIRSNNSNKDDVLRAQHAVAGSSPAALLSTYEGTARGGAQAGVGARRGDPLASAPNFSSAGNCAGKGAAQEKEGHEHMSANAPGAQISSTADIFEDYLRYCEGQRGTELAARKGAGGEGQRKRKGREQLGRRVRSTGGGRCNDIAGGWMAKGNEYVGRRVRRSVTEEEKIVGAADGEIVGWLPAEKADYVSDITHAPVALWRVLYDDATLGEEDLEEFEVQDAIDSFERDQWADMGEDHLQRATRRRLYLQTQQISSSAIDVGTNEDGNRMEEASVRKGFREVERRQETSHKEYADIDDELEGLSQVSERKSGSKNKQKKRNCVGHIAQQFLQRKKRVSQVCGESQRGRGGVSGGEKVMKKARTAKGK